MTLVCGTSGLRVTPSPGNYEPMNPQRQVAFLRGLNVGGKTLIKMNELKKGFEALGFQNVSTVLASGNVVFESRQRLSARARIEAMLAERFGLEVRAILRDAGQIGALLKSNPFRRAAPNSDIKVQVTFLGEEANPDAKFPVRLPAAEFQVVQVSSLELICALDLSSNARTPELMRWLEKKFGRNLTTRTWETVEKVAAILQA